MAHANYKTRVYYNKHYNLGRKNIHKHAPLKIQMLIEWKTTPSIFVPCFFQKWEQ